MTLFSRCDASQSIETSLRTSGPRRTGLGGSRPATWSALAGFCEDVSILFRYAAGLDYYRRDQRHPVRHTGSELH